MAVYYHPLPIEEFPERLQPRIKRLNHELRDLFALEGMLNGSRSPTKRSDDTVARRQQTQVDVTRVSGLQTSGSAASDLTDAMINILEGEANLVWDAGFGPVLSVVDNLGATRTYRATLIWQTSVLRPQLQWVEVT